MVDSAGSNKAANGACGSPRTRPSRRREGMGEGSAASDEARADYFASPEIASPAFLAVSPTLLAAEVTAASRRFSAPPRLNR